MRHAKPSSSHAKKVISTKKETWGTLTVLSRLLGWSISSIRSKLKTARSIKGKDASGRTCNFYALPDVRKSCRVLGKLPKANKAGIIRL